jgi:hypothetical protein
MGGQTPAKMRAPAQRLADVGDGREELLGLADVLVARAEWDVDDLGDGTGARRDHDHPLGEEHRLGNRVRDEHHRRAGLRAEPDEL